MQSLSSFSKPYFSITKTVLLVSHDRAFLDNVVTSTLAYDSDGVFRRYAGGYADWL